MSVAFLATAFAGFAPTYYLKGFSAAPPLMPLLHIHALVFTAWLVLLLTQTGLVATRRVGLHMRLGLAGALLAAVMIPLGMMTAIAGVQRGLIRPGSDATRALMFLIFPLGQMVIFGAFTGAGLWYRRRPEFHRRLMLLATVSLMAPAISRLLPEGELRSMITLLLSTGFVLVAIIYDWKLRGRPHSIYLWGALILLLSGPLRFGLGHTPAWQWLARFLVA